MSAISRVAAVRGASDADLVGALGWYAEQEAVFGPLNYWQRTTKAAIESELDRRAALVAERFGR